MCFVTYFSAQDIPDGQNLHCKFVVTGHPVWKRFKTELEKGDLRDQKCEPDLFRRKLSKWYQQEIGTWSA